jgi:transcriptional regulator with XRE-family HTH domain
MIVNVPFLTKSGLIRLGKLLEASRVARGWSLDRLVVEIHNQTGQMLTKSAISHLERGNVDPKWNTLALLTATGYVVKPSGDPYSVGELFAIASEQLDIDGSGEN